MGRSRKCRTRKKDSLEDLSHLDILRQGVEAWNEWRERNPSAIPSLSEANLEEAKLTEANLTKTKLTETKLSGAYLTGATFSGTYHLTQNQIERTHGNEQTELPDHLKRPAAWS